MSTLLWIGVAVVCIGVVLALLRRARRSAWQPARGSPETRGGNPLSQGWTPRDAGEAVRVRLASEDLTALREEIQDLHVVRADVQRVGDLLERLLQEVTELQGTRVNPPASEPVRAALRGAAPDPWTRPSPRADEARHPDPRPRRDPLVLDPPLPAPVLAQSGGPPPGAVNVEAKYDAVVPTQGHPPEAWMERSGGEGDVWLNPAVPLTDAALQRWSTFFDWERAEPGARYHVTRPARVTWAGGSMVRKGAARPA